MPDAAVPSARYTVPLIVVSAGPWARDCVDNVNATSSASAGKIAPFAVVGKHLLFTANHLRMSFSLLVSARHSVRANKKAALSSGALQVSRCSSLPVLSEAEGSPCGSSF